MQAVGVAREAKGVRARISVLGLAGIRGKDMVEAMINPWAAAVGLLEGVVAVDVAEGGRWWAVGLVAGSPDSCTCSI